LIESGRQNEEMRISGRVVAIGNARLDFRLAVPRLPLLRETLIGSADTRVRAGKGLRGSLPQAHPAWPDQMCSSGSARSWRDGDYFL
jgi:hypothetical protein